MGNFTPIIESIFSNIINKYDLKFVPIDKDTSALVGYQFAICIFVSREGVSIYYVIPNDKNELIDYLFEAFIGSKLDDEDRENIGKMVSHDDHVIGKLKIIAKGLQRHWGDILNGDKSWVPNYKNHIYGGPSRKANEEDVRVLKPIFDKQRQKHKI